MEKENKSGIVGVIITIIILILLVIFTNADSGNISIIENIANSIVVPVENGLTYLKNKLNNNDKFFENIEQLKQQLNLAEKYGQFTTVPGTIISRDISNYSKTLVINIGSDNGIKEKMTVIAEEGLVGYVVSTTNKTAKIQTITDSASATSCLASSTRDTMICKGTIENKPQLSASNIATDARIIQGDSVETSGLGGIYVKGIHVGKIKKVNAGSNKTDSYAVIETAVDFEKLETVLVITN